MSVQVKAKANDVRLAPRKVGEVTSLVGGRSVEDALVILEHTPRRAAKSVAKVISSAAANAENNNKLDPKTLRIKEISVGNGFALKRYRPAAHGRANPFKKMTSNILVVLEGTEKAKKETAAKKSAKKTDTKKADAADYKKSDTKESKKEETK